MINSFIFRTGEGDGTETHALPNGIKLHYGDKSFVLTTYNQKEGTANFDVYRYGRKVDTVSLEMIRELFIQGSIVAATTEDFILYIPHTDEKYNK